MSGVATHSAGACWTPQASFGLLEAPGKALPPLPGSHRPSLGRSGKEAIQVAICTEHQAGCIQLQERCFCTCWVSTITFLGPLYPPQAAISSVLENKGTVPSSPRGSGARAVPSMCLAYSIGSPRRASKKSSGFSRPSCAPSQETH